MKRVQRDYLFGAAAIAALFALSPAYAGSDTSVEVNSGTGASVEVEQHHGILPRNRGAEVHVNTPAPDVEATVPPPSGGTVVEEHSETTIHHD
ncbi:hypothetical protein [Methyloceanibacter sp.]|uniref:hypothetical protein n=1 Tax=Methyloceanibacter sp. TaxID=1965321 RepID=UPI002D2CAFA8|nr:hypothetical protein [Methyloceanibacter sp.]HZP08663.1 hypothetical protein [Methyloceanibacter sp.]